MAEERLDSSSQADPASNYLYLHPSKNPVASLVSLVLDVSNLSLLEVLSKVKTGVVGELLNYWDIEKFK